MAEPLKVEWAFDADNHYYEAIDAFTRHIEPEFAKRAMQWAEVNGRQLLLVGGKINRFIPNPTFDPCRRRARSRTTSGATTRRARASRTSSASSSRATRPYRDRDVRLGVMDEQRIEGALFFPTLGVGMEQALINDLPAARAAFRAFNRWLDDDWGFAYQDRIYGVPYLTLSDLDNAVAELEWVLDRDARVVLIGTGPVMTAEGLKSPADPRFDPFWARIQEAGVAVVFHGGDSAYRNIITMWGEPAEMEAFRFDPLRSALSIDVVADTLAAIILHGLLDRFPRLRFATIETGADWVAPLLKRLGRSTARPRWPSRTTRSSSSSATCGCRRSTRTTSTSCATCSPPTTCCSAPTGPTPRACATRCRSPRTSPRPASPPTSSS